MAGVNCLLDSYVALDLETTGINPRLDRIIEVGMIKYRAGAAVETYHSLVRPGVKIPLRIKNLTGIDDLMVAGAPGFDQIRGSLADFIEGENILGHSVGFDLGFLENRLGRPIHNPAFDTLELARITLPSAGRYRLANLCALAGIETPRAHRALDDARAAARLFDYLVGRLCHLDGHLLAKLETLFKKAGLAWPGASAVYGGPRPGSFADLPFDEPELAQGGPGPYRPAGDWGYVDPQSVARLLSAGSVLEKSVPAFQYRQQQAEMAEEVAGAFNDHKFLLVEAGTGTGKSLAYLVPALLWAAAGGPRVVISTGTINLQDQLWHKDLPQLLKCLGLGVRVALAKGRGNYLCLRRWEAALADGPAPGQESRLFARVLVWISETRSGDRVELNLNLQEEEIWLSICAHSDHCLGAQCRHFARGCFVSRSRREAESAGLIITNHALLFSDLKANNLILPAYGPLVIDEAHHLEDAATEHLGRQVSRRDLRRWLTAVAKAVTRCWELVPPSEAGTWMDGLVSLREDAGRLRLEAEGFFSLVRALVSGDREASGGELINYRIKDGCFGDNYGPLWAEYRNLAGGLRTVLGRIRKIAGLLQAWTVENDAWAGRLKDFFQLSSGGEEFVEGLEFIFEGGDQSFVNWVSVSGQGDWYQVSLHASPVRVGEILYQKLFSAAGAVVLTSATLTVNGSFNFFSERVGIDRVDSARVIKKQAESPFAYERQSLLCLVRDLPQQGLEVERGYLEAVASAVRDLATVTGGKTLVLFTSHRVLREVHALVREDLEEEGIDLFGHNIDGNRSRLVEEFKLSRRAVLMGAASFWEGIDVPGDSLTCVVIVKLPFAAPSAPVLEARMEDLEMCGRSSFYEYYLPLAAIRFKQGFGRLIRTESDRGVVVVLDRRLLEKRYGRFFLGSLPVRDHFSGDLHQVRGKMEEWLRGSNL